MLLAPCSAGCHRRGRVQRKGLSHSLDVGRDGFEGGIDTPQVLSVTETHRATAYRELVELVE